MFRFSREGSGSVFSHASNAHNIVVGWLRADPWLLGAGSLLAPAALLVRRLRPAAVAMLLSIAVVARPGGYLPVPYLIVLLPLAALLTAGVADSLWTLAERRGASLPVRLAWIAGVRVPAAAMAAAMIAVALTRVGPAWASDLERQLGSSVNGPSRAAERWMNAHVRSKATILVDNTLWLDLVRSGFQRENVIWYYKLDLDPGVGDEFRVAGATSTTSSQARGYVQPTTSSRPSRRRSRTHASSLFSARNDEMKSDESRGTPMELTVIVPTRNESATIEELVERLDESLTPLSSTTRCSSSMTPTMTRPHASVAPPMPAHQCVSASRPQMSGKEGWRGRFSEASSLPPTRPLSP